MITALPPQVRVYGVSPWVRLLFWGVLGPISLGLVAMLWAPDGHGTGYFTAPMGVLLACFVQWFLSRVRLELSPEGIRTCSPGGTVETSWDNVAGVRLGVAQPGLITREPMEGKRAYRIAAYSGLAMYGQPMYDSETRAWMNARRFIPLKSFGWHLKHGDLLGEIERFAPQAGPPVAPMAASQPKPKPAGAVPKASTREDRLIWLFAALFVGGMITLLIFTPKPGNHLSTFGLCFLLAFSALLSFLSALTFFRKGAIFMGILLAVFFGMMMLSMVAAVRSLFP